MPGPGVIAMTRAAAVNNRKLVSSNIDGGSGSALTLHGQAVVSRRRRLSRQFRDHRVQHGKALRGHGKARAVEADEPLLRQVADAALLQGPPGEGLVAV